MSYDLQFWSLFFLMIDKLGWLLEVPGLVFCKIRVFMRKRKANLRTRNALGRFRVIYRIEDRDASEGEVPGSHTVESRCYRPKCFKATHKIQMLKPNLYYVGIWGGAFGKLITVLVKTPESSFSPSTIGQEACPQQTLNLLVPWFWTFQPSEPWEINCYCLSQLV